MRSGKLITRLDRYVFRQFLLALIAVTGGLTALIWLTQSLRFVELVVNHGLSFGVFMELTGLLIPSFVAVILPITTFVVVQFIYMRLAGDRELTVMRAAGLSPFALSRPALVLAVLAVAACYGLNMVVVPASLQAFREFQWEIRNKVVAFLLQEGVFTQISSDVTVYVRSRDPSGVLRGILIDDARDKRAHATVLAERGRLVEGANGPEVLLFNGTRQEIDPKTGRLDILTFHQNVLDLADAAHGDSTRVPDMSEVSLSALLDPHPANPRDAPKWIAEAHKRLTTPLTALSFALVALLSVLTGTFRRHGSLLRPLAGVAAVVGLLALELLVQDMAARNNRLLALVWIQAIVPGMVCGWLLLGPPLVAALAGLGAPAHAAFRRASGGPGHDPGGDAVALHRPAVHRLGAGDAGRPDRAGFAVRFHRAAAPVGDPPRSHVRPGGRDRGAAAAVHRHAGAAIRRAAWRDAELLAADPLIGADRGAGSRRFGLGVPDRAGAVRAAAGRLRHRRDQPDFLGDVRPRGNPGEHVPERQRAARWT